LSWAVRAAARRMAGFVAAVSLIFCLHLLVEPDYCAWGLAATLIEDKMDAGEPLFTCPVALP
jgi:hypothetical protein